MSTRAIKRIERLLRRGNVSGLCRAASHRDPLVRRRAVRALGELAEPGSVMCISKALEEETDTWVKQWGIEALARIGTSKAVDELTRYMFHADRDLSRFATQEVRNHPSAYAQTAALLFEILKRNAFDELETAGPDAARVLEIVTRSALYASWPTGKRKKVLDFAMKRDMEPKMVGRSELAQMGMFVSGVHTINDLTDALTHRNADVRIAAAKELGKTDAGWVRGTLLKHLAEEIEEYDEPTLFEIALARSLDKLGDERAVDRYEKNLSSESDIVASRAANALSRIQTTASLKALFRYALDPEVAYRTPMMLAALEKAGPDAVENLKDLFAHPSAEVRRLMVRVVLHSQHPQMVNYLAMLAQDDHAMVQRAALDAFVELNTEPAAETLYNLLAATIPRGWVINALASITHSSGARYLKHVEPNATIMHGLLLDEDGDALAEAHVQLVIPHDRGTTQWKALTERALTHEDGTFTLAFINYPQEHLPHIKVVRHNQADKPYYTEVRLPKGFRSHVEVRINRFFDRLQIWVNVVPE